MEKLAVGVKECFRPGRHLLRGELDDNSVTREEMRGRNQPLHQQRLEGFHALHRNALGQFLQHGFKARILSLKLGCTLAHISTEQHLSNSRNSDGGQVPRQ